MPDGDGLDVLRAARAARPDAGVILLTAYAGWESAKEAMQLGAFDYFEKGREPDELLHRIDRALARSAAAPREREPPRVRCANDTRCPGCIAALGGDAAGARSGCRGWRPPTRPC